MCIINLSELCGSVLISELRNYVKFVVFPRKHGQEIANRALESQRSSIANDTDDTKVRQFHFICGHLIGYI